MKVVIAGSRSAKNYQDLLNAIQLSGFEITEVVCGGASGGDRLGEVWADINAIPCKKFEPDWSVGKHAGFLRNQKMIDYADALIVLWDGQSKGTEHSINLAKTKKIPVYIYRFNNEKTLFDD